MISGQPEKSPGSGDAAWRRLRRGRLGAYALGLGTAFVALALSLVFREFIRPHVFLFFFVAILTTAWFGGRGPAVMTAALSVFFLEFFVIGLSGLSGLLYPAWWVRLGMAVAVSAVIITITARVRTAERRMRERSRTAKRALEQAQEAAALAESAAVRLRAVLDSAADAIITLDPNGCIETMNPAAERMFGYGPDELVGRSLLTLLYTEREGDGSAADLAPGGPRERIGRRNDGTMFPVSLSISETPLPDRLVYTVILRDTSDQKRAERERRELLEREREAREQATGILESITDAFYALDEEWRFTYVNAKAEEVWGRPRAELLGRVIWDEFPQAIGSASFHAHYRAVREQQAQHLETVSPMMGTWVDLRLYPAKRGGVSAYFLDITERKRTERAERLLADVGAVLATTLDERKGIEEPARLATEWTADTAVVYLREDDGTIRQAAAVRVGPRRQLVEVERGPVEAAVPPEVRVVIETGQSMFVPGVLQRFRPADAEEAGRLVRADAEPTSQIVAPLRIRDRTIGAMMLATVRGGKPPLEAADVPVAEELARRAAMMLDNARLYQRAERASRAKSQFLSIMSHELRTPLGGIIGYADLMQSGVVGPVNERQQEQLGRIKAAGWHLVSIIDGILTFTRADAGREHVRMEAVDAAAVTREALELIQASAEPRSIVVTGDVPDTPVMIWTDPGKLRQILLNLLGNAVKFSDGTVELRLRTGPEGVRFSVRDQGPGIAAEHLEWIFEPFTQIDQTATRSKGGAGLGLAVSRRLARLLGGDIAVESRLGAGSTFILSLPYSEPAAGDPGRGAAAAARHA